MIIKTLLVCALLLCAAYGLLAARSRLVRWPLVAAAALGIHFVLQPELANQLAARLGVGRGADLLLYCWVVISLALFARLQFALMKAHEHLSELTRQLALVTARAPADAGAAPADGAS